MIVNHGSLSGSSPHTRGTQPWPTQIRIFERFIPAYAGNTNTVNFRLFHQSVHPRIRGEHIIFFHSLSTTAGSSPHTRGTLQRFNAPATRQRFIPAYAGNTHLNEICATHDFGSSPHTRGTLIFFTFLVVILRFIPAYAGNTQAEYFGWLGKPVHPRIRGEHSEVPNVQSRVPGSSPHTRGTQDYDALKESLKRFIPAYAGNTDQAARSCAAPAVHPRIRGEHENTAGLFQGLFGSSPHTRGTRNLSGCHTLGCRFIPAYAGNTSNSSTHHQLTSVHPRIRGEHPLERIPS